MPPLSQGEYLVDLLFRIGPVKKDGALEGPDLRDWEYLMGIELSPWEAEALAKMSNGYAAEMHAAVKPDAPPPWPAAVPMWRWVKNQKAERALDKFEEREERRQRRKARVDRQ